MGPVKKQVAAPDQSHLITTWSWNNKYHRNLKIFVFLDRSRDSKQLEHFFFHLVKYWERYKALKTLKKSQILPPRISAIFQFFSASLKLAKHIFKMLKRKKQLWNFDVFALRALYHSDCLLVLNHKQTATSRASCAPAILNHIKSHTSQEVKWLSLFWLRYLLI